MFPVIAQFGSLKIYAYGLMIGLGIFFGVIYLYQTGKKEIGLTDTLVNRLLIYLVLAGVIGGKVLLFFEAPSFYFNNPGKLLSGNGFVFYGSLIFCMATLIWFIRKHKLPLKPTFDLIAIVTCIVHAFGRLGCFMAGCCYGTPSNGLFSVTYTNAASSAPLGCALHPVQLYEVAGIVIVLIILLWVKRNKTYPGQVFAVYVMLYPMVRFITELFRGDEQRGYLFNELLSHSQFISVLIFATGLFLWMRWRKQVY